MERKPQPTTGYYDYLHSPVPFLHAPPPPDSDKHSKLHAFKHSRSHGKSITRSVLGNQMPGTSFTQATLDGNTKKAHKALLSDKSDKAEVLPMPSPTKPKKKSLTAQIRESSDNHSDTDSIPAVKPLTRNQWVLAVSALQRRRQGDGEAVC